MQLCSIHARTVTIILFSSFALTALGADRNSPADTKDTIAIKEMVQRYEQAVNSGDADASANLYTKNAVRMPPGEPAVVGKEAIRTWYSEGFNKITISEKILVEEFVFSGDLAICRIHARYTITDKSTCKATPKKSKGLWVFERQADKAWKMRYACYCHRALQNRPLMGASKPASESRLIG